MTLPEWLPSMLDLNGDWDDCLEQLYTVFTRDFKGGTLRLAGMPIWHDRNLIDGYEACFWHLVTRDDKQGGVRRPDLLRAERLPWCAAVLAHAHDPAVKLWRYREGDGRVRTYAWLESGDYVVVLEAKQKRIGLVAFMITAYHVDGPSRRRNLQQRYENREP